LVTLPHRRELADDPEQVHDRDAYRRAEALDDASMPSPAA